MGLLLERVAFWAIKFDVHGTYEHDILYTLTQERKSFDEKFVRMDTKRLCELTSAADSLQLKPLVDLTSRALARVIEGKSPEEIREIFHLPDDLTEVFCHCKLCTCLLVLSFFFLFSFFSKFFSLQLCLHAFCLIVLIIL